MHAKLAIVVSHPIQHFVHLYRTLAARAELDVKVFFMSRVGVDAYFDKDMGTQITWAGSMLDGYAHAFLAEAANITAVSKAIDNPSVEAALESFGPDVVIGYGYVQRTQHRVRRWAAKHGVPLLMIGDTNAVVRRPLYKEIARRIVLPLLFRDVAGFLTPGDQNEEQLMRLGQRRSKMFRSPFTIDEEAYRTAQSDRPNRRASVRRELGIAGSTFVCVAVGKFIERKRPLDAIRAVAQTAKSGVDVSLVYCGNGPLREQAEALARELDAPVIFAGFVNIDRLPDYFAAADALLHVAAEDPHPLICSEAAAMGLPLILSDKIGTIGATDVARPGENTLVAPVGDIAGFARAIASLAADTALQDSMSAASTHCFDENSLPVSVDGVLRAVRAVTGQQAAAA